MLFRSVEQQVGNCRVGIVRIGDGRIGDRGQVSDAREEVVALVVDDDEGGELLDLDPPDRLHPELREFLHLDLPDRVQRQLGGGAADRAEVEAAVLARSEEHTSELQSLMRISYAVFCLKK